MKLTFKIWLLIIFLVFSLILIFGIPPRFLESGLVVSSIDSNSTLFEQGLRKGEIIKQIDEQKIDSLEKFSEIISSKYPSDENTKLTIKTDKAEYIYFSKTFEDVSVSEIPKTNLKLGLDLAGGARAFVQAENRSLSTKEVNDLVDITSNRLNAFGLTDLRVVPVSDLSGNNFMKIEIAGATPADLEKLISEQGKFEAKIGNETVFIGGDRDVASVGRDAQNSRIESCSQDQEGNHFCKFSFTITLSGDAAKRHAEITDKLLVNATPEGNYLSEKLDLFLDDKLVSSLYISEGLKGRVTTQILISGSGQGDSKDLAYENAKLEMKQLQTVLMTGSLPYKLEIVKLDTISPNLGEDFSRIIIFIGLIVIFAVAIIVFISYRSAKASLALILTTVSEAVIILGIAAMIDWNLDLPGIAGILATLGTGIDDLIIILDESTSNISLSIKQRLKRAFAIIMGAYFTSLVALLPLLSAGGGVFQGFAVTTIIGISVGVLITRPAFSDIIRKWSKK